MKAHSLNITTNVETDRKNKNEKNYICFMVAGITVRSL